jgi:pyruvate formate lyase activating enzyme
VTNGYINEEPLRKLSECINAMNIDVKAFSEEFYKKICKGSLQDVLRTCELAKKLSIYVEITYLIIPGYNDSEKEIAKFCRWVSENLGKDTVVHFSRFYPHYKFSELNPTPFPKMLKAYKLAKKEKLDFVYLGNLPHGNYENTYCPSCQELLIERYGFSLGKVNLQDSICSKCGTKLPGVF